MMKDFKSTIKEARLANKVGLRRLADSIGISASYLSEVEGGIKPAPSDDIVLKLAGALHLDVENLRELARISRIKYKPENIKNVFGSNTELAISFLREAENASDKELELAMEAFIKSIKGGKGL